MLAPLLALALAVAPANTEPAPDAGGQPTDPGVKYELPAPAAAALQAQLQRMNDAGVHGDFGALVDLMYPPTVARLGGRDRAVAQVQEAAKGMAHEGARLVEAKGGKILGCVKTARQLQCVVGGEQTLKITGGQLRGPTETLAFSEDGGQRWTFLLGGQDPDAMRAGLPELSPLLPLGTVPAPKFEPDKPGKQ